MKSPNQPTKEDDEAYHTSPSGLFSGPSLFGKRAARSPRATQPAPLYQAGQGRAPRAPRRWARTAWQWVTSAALAALLTGCVIGAVAAIVAFVVLWPWR